jgi:hypothetical protein
MLCHFLQSEENNDNPSYELFFQYDLLNEAGIIRRNFKEVDPLPYIAAVNHRPVQPFGEIPHAGTFRTGSRQAHQVYNNIRWMIENDLEMDAVEGRVGIDPYMRLLADTDACHDKIDPFGGL